MHYYLSILVTVLTIVSLYGQQPCYWQLTSSDGLPTNEVYDLYYDSRGYMWMGTDKGLCKYNGIEFTTYKNENQIGEAVSALQEDSEGRIWCRNFKDQFFYVENDSLYEWELPDSISLYETREFFIDDKDNRWIIQSKKSDVYRYDPHRNVWRRWIGPKSNVLTDIVKHTDGLIYGLGDAIWRIDESIPIDTIERVTAAFSDNCFGSLSVDSFLYTIQSRRVADNAFQQNILRLKEDKLEKFSPLDAWGHNPVEKSVHIIRSSRDSSIWVGTFNGGALCISNPKSLSMLNETLYFPKESITDIVLDKEGNYWFSTLKSGIFIVPNLALNNHSYENAHFSAASLGLIERTPDGNLMISNRNGELLSYNTKKDTIECIYNTPKSNPLRSITWDNESFLVQTFSFFAMYHKGEPNYHARDFLVWSGSKNIALYKNYHLIADGIGGVMLRDRSQYPWGKLAIDSAFFPSIRIRNIKKNIRENTHVKVDNSKRCNWVFSDELNERFLAVWGNYLKCYPEKDTAFWVLNEEKEKIIASKITQTSDGTIWVSTIGQGIYGLDRDLKISHHFTTQDGLLMNTIREIETDGNELWLLTSRGIQYWNPATNENRLYDTKDGLLTDDIYDMAVLEDKVWLSTAKGLLSFDKNMAAKNNASLPICIKSIAIHDRDTVLQGDYILDYTQNSLTIYVEGVSYRSQGNFHYKFRMLGIDTTWTTQEASTDFMRYPLLTPGDYTFEVVAVNEDGVESFVPARIKFKITPPYWETWWFFLLMLGLLLLVVGAVAWNQIRTQRLQNRVSALYLQALQSQMNPHFIFNVLTAVQNLWLQKKNEAALMMQSSFARLLRKIFQYSNQEAISIEQVEDFINNYLDLEQIRFEYQVEIDFIVDDALEDDDCKIPPLLIQPIIENSFKHGLFHKETDKKMWIRLEKEDVYLYCFIEDNGVGRKTTAMHQRSSGLNTTKERLKILQERIVKTAHPHDNLKITDLKDENGQPTGTRVELWIPFIQVL